MRMSGIALLMLTGALMLSAPADAQSMDSAFSSLDESLDKLSDASNGTEAIPPETIALLRKRMERLRGAAVSVPPGDRTDYARSLDAQAELLAQVARDPEPSAAREAIDATAADLDIKIRSTPGFGAANVVYGHIDVTVRTLRDSHPVNGLVVWATPVALARFEPLFRFDQMSSPTTKSLPPGRYEFTLKKDGQVIARERADVGLTSSRAVTLDLSVPPGG
jgi:hypothetical protein